MRRQGRKGDQGVFKEIVGFFYVKGVDLLFPFLKLAYHLKIDSWKVFFFWDGLFSRASWLVLGSESNV